MTAIANPNERLRAVRAQIDHPIVDADAHQLEVLAVVMDFVRDVGGPQMPDRLMNYFMHVRRAFRQTNSCSWDSCRRRKPLGAIS